MFDAGILHNIRSIPLINADSVDHDQMVHYAALCAYYPLWRFQTKMGKAKYDEIFVCLLNILCDESVDRLGLAIR